MGVARVHNWQVAHYCRKTINYNDSLIGTGVLLGTIPEGSILLCGGRVYNAATTPAVAAPGQGPILFINRTAWDGSAAVTAGTNGSSYNDLFGSGDITEGTLGVYTATGDVVYNSDGATGAGFVILNSATEVGIYAKSTGSGATTGKGTFVIPYIPDNDG